MRVVEGQEDRALLGGSAHRGGERLAHGKRALGRAESRTELGIEHAQSRERAGGRPGEPRRFPEPCGNEPGDGAPFPVSVGLHRARRRHGRVVQPDARHELLEQPGLPLPGLALHEHHLSATRFCSVPGGDELGELRRASHERRARPRGRRRRQDATAHARIPDPLGQPQRLRPRRRGEALAQRPRHVGGHAQRAGPIARQGECAHGRPGGGLGGQIEGHRAQREAHGSRGVASGELAFRRADQGPQPLRTPDRPLGAEPALELVRLGDRESFKKLPLDEPGGAGPVAARIQLGKPVAVQRDGVRAQPNLIHLHPHCVVPQDAAENPQSLAERVAGLLLIPIAPQQAHEMLARAAPPRAPREIDQEGEVLAPQELGRGVRAVHRHAGRSHRPAVDSRRSGHGSGPVTR